MSSHHSSLKILAGNKTIGLHPEVYVPSDDSMLLAHHSRTLSRGNVLDMGTGTGIQAIAAAERAKKVLAVDVNETALRLAEKNARLNHLSKKISFRKSDLFSAIKPSEKFDLIIFNPPYLPTSHAERTSGILDAAWNGGKGGREVIDKFLRQFAQHLAPGGSLLMLHCDLADTGKTVKALTASGFSVRIIDEMKVFNEKLSVLLATK
jgi:release factor glutamine methyltransferase